MLNTLRYIAASAQAHSKEILEASTAYASGAALTLYGSLAVLDWKTLLASLGGFILFVARASVDIPKAIDYWRERRERKRK